MQKDIVLYDACVLYPAPVRDLLMHLALADLYHAKWTNEIHEEWIRGVLRTRKDLPREFLERTRDKMNQHVRDALVLNYEKFISTLPILPDRNDAHVFAAAIKSKSNIILTYNLKDFPTNVLKNYDMIAQHPDSFLMDLLEKNHEVVCIAVNRHYLSLKNPPKSVEAYLETLKKHNLKGFVKKLRVHWPPSSELNIAEIINSRKNEENLN